MMKTLLKKIRRILRNKKVQRIIGRYISIAAAVVVFVTTYALVLPAITMESVADCGVEEHQHDDGCYEETLICSLSEEDGHVHTEDCYEPVLTCGKEVHVHGTECYHSGADSAIESGSWSDTAVAADSYPDEAAGADIGDASAEDDGNASYDDGSEAETDGVDSSVSYTIATPDEAAAPSASEESSGESGDMPDGNTSASDSHYADDADSAVSSSAPGTETDGIPAEEFDSAATAGTDNSALADSNSYIPSLDPLDFRTILTKQTGVYYYRPADGETVENSALLTDWNQIDEDTKLGKNDLLRVYLAYTIPAGSLNETNPVATYRLPSNLRLTDAQVEAINKAENGLATQIRKYNEQAEELTNSDNPSGSSHSSGDYRYEDYLGVEAVEGTRTPDDDIDEYLAEHDGQETISAVVRVENVYDEENGDLLGQDLIFTFAPYTVDKNAHRYDASGQPVKAGEKVRGWLALDFNMEQVDWSESVLSTVEKEDGTAVQRNEKTAAVVFVEEGKDSDNKSIEEIRTDLILVDETAARDKNADDVTIEDASGEKETEQDEAQVDEDSEQTKEDFKSGTLTSEGPGYKITLDFTADAKIPEGAYLNVSEITRESDAEAYEACLEEARKAIPADPKTTVDDKASRFFDIEIMMEQESAEGTSNTKIEPAAPVSVNIQLFDTEMPETEDAYSADQYKVLHFAEEGTEEITKATAQEIDAAIENDPAQNLTNSDNSGKSSDDAASATVTPATEIQFEAESFSVYGVVYTVDFHYEVNGKMYEFSIPGGGFVSLEHVVEVLGISNTGEISENGAENAEKGTEKTNDFVGEVPSVEESGEKSNAYNEAIKLNEVMVNEATQKFVADVESVEFSNPELVWVGKVDEAVTVGGLKEVNGLEVEYSADLTEDQIAEINAQTVKAGDWALISVQPFTLEETLTVTMKTGDVFTISVTDAQIKKTVIDAKGETWEITVTYDDSAEIPDGARLEVKELLPEEEDYLKYYDQSMKKVGVINTSTDSEKIKEASSIEEIVGIEEDVADLIVTSDLEEDEEQTAVPKSEYVRIFDIQIWANDQEIQPKNAVTVNIKLLDAPEDSKEVPSVVHFAKNGAELMELAEKSENGEGNGLQFVTDEFSVYSVVYAVDFFFEVNGKVYGFNMNGADSVSLQALVEALHVYEVKSDDEKEAESPTSTTYEEAESYVESQVNNDELEHSTEIRSELLDLFMREVETVTFSNEELLVPAKVDEDTTVGNIKTTLKLFPTYPLGLKQSEVLALNEKEYSAGDWALISMKPFDTQETLTITLKNGDSFKILVTDAQDAVMIGDQVQTITNPAGTTIDLFDYWIINQNLVGRDGWGDLNQSEGWSDDSRGLNGTGNNKGINSSTTDTEHGHALKFSPAWEGTVYNGTKNNWTSVNGNGKDGLNSYTGSGNPFQGIVQGQLVNGYPTLTNNGTIGSNEESLAYLFNPTVTHDGKASYSNVNQLMYVDKEGYYTYDSRDYAAAFNTVSKTFTVTEQTSTDTEVRGFWPFGTQNFWAGMHLNTQFSMPANGEVLNPSGLYKPMQFEFSGDDDTWLYVDSVLVGDGGGIHNRSEIDINFAAGKVTVTGKKDTYHAGDFEEVKWLDDIFKDAGKYNENDWEDIPGDEGLDADRVRHKRFKAGTYHTFDMFYLERGGGESNLYIHYNLVSTADFTSHKAFFGTSDSDVLSRDKFQFELIGLDGKYRGIRNADGKYVLGDLVDADHDAIMPETTGASASNPGTVAEPYYNGNTTYTFTGGSSANSQTYKTGASEDGNVNFGYAQIAQDDMHDADTGEPPIYRYIIREIVPDDAYNATLGKTWAQASEEERAQGGFVKDNITYDPTVYYMTGCVTSWEETDASGQTVIRHGISKTYYTDDTFTTVKDDVSFASFENRWTTNHGNVDFTKKSSDGEVLSGAEFTLYSDEACTDPAKDLDHIGRPVWKATSGSDGKVSFENVRVGTYYMKETKAPDGYGLSNTVYKVVIEDDGDSTKTSKITVLGDDTNTPVETIENYEAGKLKVVKKWLNKNGSEISGGDHSVTVQLKRKHQIEQSGQAHQVTVHQSVMDYGRTGEQQWGEPTVVTRTGDTVVIDWDDEWQNNFNWSLTVGSHSYEGWIGDETVITDNYKFERLDPGPKTRRLTVYHVDGDITFETKYHVNWLYDDSHWANLNDPEITGQNSDPTYTVEDDTAFNSSTDASHKTALGSENSWTYTWTIGGKESDYAGYDFPATDDNGIEYLYYVQELDANGTGIEIGGIPTEGFTLDSYSDNNSTGITNQGIITVYNKSVDQIPVEIQIKIIKLIKDTQTPLPGAGFSLEQVDSEGHKVPDGVQKQGITGDGGEITFTNLVPGRYKLTETDTPEGYVKREGPYYIVITEDESSAVEEGHDYILIEERVDNEYTVENEPGAALPNTGGPGTTPFYLFGIMLTILAGAGMLLLFRKQKY